MAHKYWAKKVEIDWIKFDSKVEWLYYEYLKWLKANWDITDFTIQPRYELQSKFTKLSKKYMAINYVADFEVIFKDGARKVIDIKGMPTEGAKLKRKLFEYKYPTMNLHWIVRYQSQWVEYDLNELRKRNNRKAKKLLKNDK